MVRDFQDPVFRDAIGGAYDVNHVSIQDSWTSTSSVTVFAPAVAGSRVLLLSLIVEVEVGSGSDGTFGIQDTGGNYLLGRIQTTDTAPFIITDSELGYLRSALGTGIQLQNRGGGELDVKGMAVFTYL